MQSLKNDTTIDPSDLKSYIRFRNSGMRAQQALRAAKALSLFHAAESCGLARVRVEDDTDFDSSWMDDSQRSSWDGFAFGTVAEIKRRDGTWDIVDSVWGHVGYVTVDSPFENWYVADHLMTIRDALFEEWQNGLDVALTMTEDDLTLLFGWDAA